jgi:hypothetical protein
MLWQSLIVGAVVVLSWPMGTLACGPICFLIGLANVPGYALCKSRGDGAPARLSSGLAIGCLGQMIVTVAFATVLILFTRWFIARVHVATVFAWALWVTAFVTPLRPSMAVIRAANTPSDADTFARMSSVLTVIGTATAFVVEAIFLLK